MNFLLKLIIPVFICCCVAGCLFDSDSDNKEPIDNDTGTYILVPDSTIATAYQNGGALFGMTFEPDKIFSGDVELSFEGPSYLLGSFYSDTLTIQDNYTDLLIQIDATAPIGVSNCNVISVFAGNSDTLQFAIDIVEVSWFKDYTPKIAPAVIEWLENNYTLFQNITTNIWFGYHYYPDILIGGSRWIFISDNWVVFEERSVYPSVSWYSIESRQERSSLLYALAVQDTIVEVELSTFPTTWKEREEILSPYFDFE